MPSNRQKSFRNFYFMIIPGIFLVIPDHDKELRVASWHRLRTPATIPAHQSALRTPTQHPMSFLFEQQFSAITQQFKGIIFDNCRYIAGNCCSPNPVRLRTQHTIHVNVIVFVIVFVFVILSSEFRRNLNGF